jgi:1-deoxy-D-xylulose-5-phosphate reductoisomerase
MTSTPRRIAVLGSTGSIGQQTLEVVRWFPDRFEVVALAAGSWSEQFRAQVAEFRPRIVAVGNAAPSDLPGEILHGLEGLCEAAATPAADLVVMATVGRVGLRPSLAAVSAGKSIAIANKEVLVMAGDLVMGAARSKGAQILPIDSEHSAIWQCLRGEGEASEWASTVASLILTASGGSLRDVPASEMEQVSPAMVLAHPTWRMGPKVTVDSATLMNKGLEVIEAHWLFGLPLDRIRVVMHRESIVHSLVEFVDGSIKAQLGVADMRIPIQYALSYPERWPGRVRPLDLASIGCLSFEEIRLDRQPCLRLALESARLGRSYPAALSAANEVSVSLFLGQKLPFRAIPRLIEEVLTKHEPMEIDSVDAALEVDRRARESCLSLVEKRRGIY